MKHLSNILVGLVLASAFAWGCDSGGRTVSVDRPAGGPSGLGIVGGTATNYESWQGVIAVFTDSALCSGTLIDPEVVLTAGHCVYLPDEGLNVLSNPGAVDILGGADIFNIGGIEIAGAQAVIKHPDWNGDVSDQDAVDLALIRLDEAVEFVPF